ncbi:MAG: lytic transglycosylase domain-containing protein [Clostridia bacterium]|nr:lytic transglycosylase domain-containing protein [Clostridia bacterium]
MPRAKKKNWMMRFLQIGVVFAVTAAVIFSSSSAYAKNLFDTYRYPRKYRAHVEQYASLYGAEPNMIYAIIKAESGFDPEALSPRGAIGLMQVMPDTYKYDIRASIGSKEDVDILYEPEENIQAGIFYFAKWYRYFGTAAEALAAYHAGIGNVKTWIEYGYTDEYGFLDVEQIPISQTRAYVKRVLEYKTRYDELYGHIADQGKKIHENICREWALFYGTHYGVDSRFIMAIIKAESTFDPTCLSPSGAKGLMQILRSTYNDDIKGNLGLEEDYDDLASGKFNVKCGTYYLYWLSWYLDGKEQIAAAYNGGIGNVQRWLKDPSYSNDGITLLVEQIPDEGVRNYVNTVMKYYREYCSVYRK